MSEWSVGEPRKLSFEEPVNALQVRVVDGTVNVVGTDESSARLEVTSIEGPPLQVGLEDGTLTVGYEDMDSWRGFLKWLDRRGRQRSAVVSLAVPAGTRVQVGVIGANAFVSGIDGPTEVKGMSGDTTLVGLSGPVRTQTVSGSLEAQSLAGDLKFHSVSGDLTVVDGSGSSVRADSVSGSMIVDLDPEGPTDVGLVSVSGEIAIRLPQPVDTEIEANTASGTIANDFNDLRVNGQWGAHKITGRLGKGAGKVRATTVSGSIALLRRPAKDETEGPHEPAAPAAEPVLPAAPAPAPVPAPEPASKDAWSEAVRPEAEPRDGAEDVSGDNSDSGPGDGPSDPPADGTTDKKVL